LDFCSRSSPSSRTWRWTRCGDEQARHPWQLQRGWQFSDRRNISFKKTLYAAEQKRGRGPHPPALDARASHF
jgi:hypothetical protein